MKAKFSIGVKLYIFIIITVMAAAVGTAFLAYSINANQIDRYYKQLSYDTAANFSSFVDGDYLMELRHAVESEEYQSLREKAEEEDDESLIQEYLEEHGLWEGYAKTRDYLIRYLRNMGAIKYLYIIACGDENADHDMYLMDDDDNPIYVTGYYEVREPEFYGIDLTKAIEPTISTGDWGWLCSAYAPVYDSEGETVCQIGCDIGMDDVMTERYRSLMYSLLMAFGLTVIVLIGAVVFITRIVIKPIDSLTAEMKNFKPRENVSYEEAGVVNLNIRSRDEINELYDGIKSMQMNIIDYLNDMEALQKDKEKAEEGIKTRDEKIGKISQEAYRDPLTGVGSKAAYVNKVDELNDAIKAGHTDFAFVMVDMNDLKHINDGFGHKMGDVYINGCCHMICDVFKHSPVYRIGGDEFVAILQGADYENRYALVEKLKKMYEQTLLNNDAEPWERFSAAVGMAEHASDDCSVDLVFKRADKAMYKDKKRIKEGIGSNRFST